MIIWLNGAFGAGKTQTAFELHRRLSDSFVFDPENAGYYIRKNIPREMSRDDFQDYAMWREFNVSMLKHIYSEYGGTIIVPMTIVNPQYFDEIVGRLRNDGVVVHHFALCASKEVLRQRLRKRGERSSSWPMRQIDRCVQGLSDDVFKHHLDTDRMSIEQVAETIASMANVGLRPDRKGKLGRRLERLKTQLKHIRFPV
ncbi:MULTISPECIES: AAA family ATPase [unclassified Paenibacillus]|uniref:AAA family ATPase n=1 Tax=unclassified Paenibacillus TaxID=185978 RepID=UPI001C11ECA4|nr:MULTISPECIES: AAA family ATPase [unclassified Paenibacillus]MBU5443099.1 AAA family ATPase [Paenibacillus sp. MSJ-34]CAH0122272.1 Tunicamycin resistance protein [Paenibacillus sp. CECT 9249]